MILASENNKRGMIMTQGQYEGLQALITTMMGRLSNYMAERVKIEEKPKGDAQSKKILEGEQKGKYFVYKSGMSNTFREPKITLQRVENIYKLKYLIGQLSDKLIHSVTSKADPAEKKEKGKKAKNAHKTMSLVEVCNELSEYLLSGKKENSRISVAGGVVQNYEPASGGAWEHYSTLFASLFSPSQRRPASDVCMTECQKLVKTFLESNRPTEAPGIG